MRPKLVSRLRPSARTSRSALVHGSGRDDGAGEFFHRHRLSGDIAASRKPPYGSAILSIGGRGRRLRGRNDEGHRHGSAYRRIGDRRARVGNAADERETVDLGTAATVVDDEAAFYRVFQTSGVRSVTAFREVHAGTRNRILQRASLERLAGVRTTVRAISALRPE